MAGGWLGASGLSTRWVADGWLRKQEYIPTPGAWINQRYLSRKWTNERWLYSYSASVAATVTQVNVPGLALAKLDGSARQTTKVNATSTSLALGKFNAVANAGHIIAQANVPNLALGKFDTTVNAGVFQIADVTFTIEVASTFGYSKNVVAQNVPGLTLAAIPAIVTTGLDLNVAVTQVNLPLGVLPTSVKANSSTRAVSSIALPLGVFGCTVSVGLRVTVADTLPLALSVLDTSVTAEVNTPLFVSASLTSLALGVLDARVGAPGQGAVDTYRVTRGNRIFKVRRPKRTFAA